MIAPAKQVIVQGSTQTTPLPVWLQRSVTFNAVPLFLQVKTTRICLYTNTTQGIYY